MIRLDEWSGLVDELLVDPSNLRVDEWEFFALHQRVDVFGGFLDNGFEVIAIAIEDSVVFELLLIKDLDGFVREEFEIEIIVDITEESLVHDGWAGYVRIVAISISLPHRDDVGPLLLEENENGMLVGHPAATVTLSDQRGF